MMAGYGQFICDSCGHEGSPFIVTDKERAQSCLDSMIHHIRNHKPSVGFSFTPVDHCTRTMEIPTEDTKKGFYLYSCELFKGHMGTCRGTLIR